MQIDLVKYYLKFTTFVEQLDELKNTYIPEGYEEVKKQDARKDTKQNSKDKKTKSK